MDWYYFVTVYIAGFIICNIICTKSVDWEKCSKKSGTMCSSITGAYINIVCVSLIWFIAMFIGIPYLIRKADEKGKLIQEQIKVAEYKANR